MSAQRMNLIRHFQNLGALTQQTAITVDSLPRTGFALLANLIKQGVIRKTPDGNLYLDQVRWEETRTSRRSAAKIIILVVAGVGAAVLTAAYFMSAA